MRPLTLSSGPLDNSANPALYWKFRLGLAPLLGNAEVAGTVQFWEWIGDGATTFSF
ncbi:hypothetical protein [Tessaracoccus flavus]|uniref:hypothetical protein n=1 Tax=Tessaracoccus flavus TaxID=1610493 RepID=UPI001C409F38|nr:hypothetical protein [Tessaracoccus flavus]